MNESPANPDALRTSARAKIIWGDTPASVHEFLVAKGMSADDANALIKELQAERHAEIRKVGFRDIVIGAFLLAGTSFYFYFTFRNHNNFLRGFTWPLSFMFLFAAYGLWKFVKGLIYLFRPQMEEQSITELSD